jgi:hypothetical protein
MITSTVALDEGATASQQGTQHERRGKTWAAAMGSTVVLLLPHWPGYDWYQEVKRRGQMRDVVGPVRFQQHDGGHVVLNNGRNSISLVVALLGPHVAPGTNGTPIRSAGAPEPPLETPRPSDGHPTSPAG